MTLVSMRELYHDKQYEEAITYAADVAIRNKFNAWDYFFLFKCLYELKRYLDYLEVYKEFKSKFPKFNILNPHILNYINNNMGWSLYHSHIKIFESSCPDKSLFFKRVNYVLLKCDNSDYSPKNFVMKKAFDIINELTSAHKNYFLENKYLSYFNPLLLGAKEQVKQDVNGEIRIVASPREQWYRRKTKALVELKQFEECLTYIEQAFCNISTFHNNAEHWLNYRKAQCYFAQEKYDEADKIMNSILSKFQHWCFYEMLFNICVKKNDINKALKYGAFCATADKEHKIRVKFYIKFATFLDGIEKLHEAALHRKLTELIRAEEGWKQIQLPGNYQYQYPNDILHMDKRTVISQLNDFWKKEKEKDVAFYEGIIDKLFPNGKSGFVKSKNGKCFYFNIRDFDKRDSRKIEEGIKVRFALTERLDKKKNEMKLNAVSLSIVMESK